MTALDVVDGLVRHARPLVLEHYTPASCIPTTRVGLEVLEHYGIPAKALSVRAILDGPSYQVDLGAPDGPPGLGHLVILLDAGLLDLSLDQASRPARGIEAGPLFAPFPDDATRARFLMGGGALVGPLPAGTVTYLAVPGDRRYTRSPNWGRRDRRLIRQLAAATIRAIEESGASGQLPY